MRAARREEAREDGIGIRVLSCRVAVEVVWDLVLADTGIPFEGATGLLEEEILD